MALISSCKKDGREENLPVLITFEANNITNISADCGGEIKNKGKYEIIRQGICWSIKPNPTIADYRTKDDSDSESYSAVLTGLTPNTKYYVRAYATNYIDTGYGNEIEFQTTGETPVVSTDPISTKTIHSIRCGGNISSDGGDVIIARGVCWGESPEPLITDNKTDDGQSSGPFTSEVTNLKSNTKYYIRAYATNSVGTSYGDIQSFTLWLNVPDESITDVDGNTYHTIRIGDQIWMQENLRVTKFQNGTLLKQLSYQSDWTEKNSSGYYTNVDNAAFGYIYNGYVLIENQNICPPGWHVPTMSEWNALIDYLGGSSVAGGKMKESSDSYWISPNIGADNTSGFTALPNGYVGTEGDPHEKLEEACIMVATFDSYGNPGFIGIHYNYSSAFFNQNSSKVTGSSIRCIKN